MATARPWQVDWKRPIWKSPEKSPEQSSGRILDHAAALVLPQELGLPEDAPWDYMLTVSLMDSTNNSKRDAADVLVMEVQRYYIATSVVEEHGNDTIQSGLAILEKRTLRWPTSVLQDSIQEEDDDDDDNEDSSPPLFLDWFHRQRKRPADGVVSICLCRLPPEDPTAAQTDALDVLHLLSLEGRSETQNEWLERKLQEQRSTPQTSGQTDLVLFCLTNKGKVHLYSPWVLLNPALAQTNEEDDEVEDGLASLLLGDSLLSTIQSNMLPLSRPERTIRLSTHFLKKTRATSEPIMEIEEVTSVDQDNGKLTKLSAWDNAIWDSVLDRPSLSFQTKGNIVTHAVFAYEFLAIAGKGQRRRRRQVPARHRQGGSLSRWSDWDDASASAESTSVASTTQLHRNQQQHHQSANGGFVTFISLRNMSEVRTVYLPFVPLRLSSLTWGGMSFVMATGASRAVLIRTDAADVLTVTNGQPPSMFVKDEMETKEDSKSDSSPKEFKIHRFQILPVDIPDGDTSLAPLIVGSSSYTDPPAIVFLTRNRAGSPVGVFQRRLTALVLKPMEQVSDWFESYESRVADGQFVTVATSQSPSHFCRIDTTPEQAISNPWCYVGQGWCLVGLGPSTHFVCFDGGSATNGAFAMQMDMENTRATHGTACDVIPFNIFEYAASPTRLEEVFSVSSSASPLDEDSSINISLRATDDAVTLALKDISNSHFHQAIVSKSPPSSPRRKSYAFTREGKSSRLLRYCKTWGELDGAARLHDFRRQLPVVSARVGGGNQNCFSLSLRQHAFQTRSATSFRTILPWLSGKGDYFEASSIGLYLLKDMISLRHLWNAHDKIDDDDEVSLLEGLLDGITPVESENDDRAQRKALTDLADMTLGCMIKGGYKMSSTLLHFARQNQNYDPATAFIMLAGVISQPISAAEQQRTIPDLYENTQLFEKILWPVQSLIQVGLARENLSAAIILLNSMIPDELRCHQRTDVPAASPPSLSLCTALVGLVVSAGAEAVDLLLKLRDEVSGKSYWESLDLPTRRRLSLLESSSSCPLIRHVEVRSWIVQELRQSIESTDSFDSPSCHDKLPDEWLSSLCRACLNNSGCDVSSANTEDGQETSSLSSNDSLIAFKRGLRTLRNALSNPATGTGGLDFDVMIAALLILKGRGVQWDSDSAHSTQALLNAACHAAGRPGDEVPLFPMDSATLMRECVLAGNVEAGANLIGGKNGLVLMCCFVLIEEQQMTMEEAESFLLSESLPLTGQRNIGNQGDGTFRLEYSHKLLLSLLDDHVLSVHKYGDFDSSHSRGRVDPVFAAQTILRTWWFLTKDNPGISSTWLFGWLNQELSLPSCDSEADHGLRSKHRLACAALTRALVWPRQEGAPVEEALANRLSAPNDFLTSLSLACCGLVETLPDYIVRDSWRKMEVTKRLSSRTVTPLRGTTGRTLSTTSGYTPRRVNETMDESFVSAVSSLVDL